MTTAAKDPVLRPWGAHDLDQVLTLERDLFGVGAWSRANFAGELTAPARHYVVLDLAGTLIGYAGIALGPTSQVMTIGVDPAHRGRGYGEALLGNLIEAAVAAESVEIILEVRVDATTAQSLYRKRGFVGIGIRKNYYQREGRDALIMRKALRGIGPMGSEVMS